MCAWAQRPGLRGARCARAAGAAARSCWPGAGRDDTHACTQTAATTQQGCVVQQVCRGPRARRLVRAWRGGCSVARMGVPATEGLSVGRAAERRKCAHAVPARGAPGCRAVPALQACTRAHPIPRGQVEEAVETYERLQVAAAAVRANTPLSAPAATLRKPRLPTPRHDSRECSCQARARAPEPGALPCSERALPTPAARAFSTRRSRRRTYCSCLPTGVPRSATWQRSLRCG